MSDLEFLKQYFNNIKQLIDNQSYLKDLILVKDILKKTHANGKKIMIFGNGGSAAIASHFSVDLTKNAGVRCTNYNESDLLTCFSNDYGYERWVEKAIEFYQQLSSMDFMSSTPTLFNSGTIRPQLSSCYLNTIDDSIEGIFDVYQNNAKLSKFAGGLGNDWTPIRSNGAHIFGTKYVSLLYGFVFLSHQVGSFLGAYLGGLFHDLYGSLDYAWYISIALSLFAGLIHLPIKEIAIERKQLATSEI